jgi:23S rRNA pseudouridine1911/1915/1917 synthase
VSEENSSLVFVPAPEDQGKRLDSFLAEKIENWSRSRLQKLIEEGDVLVGNKAVKSSYKINSSDEIEVELTVVPADSFTPENIPLDIVYEDADIAVINKPAGMVVHPGAGTSGGTLANAIAWHFTFQIPDAKFQDRVGIVHRLDKDTSGLIVVAKNETAHENLSAQFACRAVFKSYLALVHGQVLAGSGTIDAALARDRGNRLRMAVVRSGRNALSLWRVRERFEKFTLLEVEIKTGRTHQIRVHLAHIKHPVVGDELYNGGRDNSISDLKIRKAVSGLGRFFLHAERLEFAHPRTNEAMNFSAPLPAELLDLLEIIRIQ